MIFFSHPRVRAHAGACVAIAVAVVSSGCATDSFLDPSKTGRFENEPTLIPILDRIDVIEDRDNRWARTTEPMPEDLLPNDLTYRLTPGDFVTVEIFELFLTSRWEVRTTRVDASGNIRLPVVGDVRAAGRTAQELEDRVKEVLRGSTVLDPEVNVLVEESSAFTWIIRGAVQGQGQYTLRDPDLRLLQAMAQAGDVLPNAAPPKRVFVIRQVPLTDAIRPSFERDDAGDLPAQPRTGEQPVNVEDLIDQLNPPGGGGGGDDGSPLVDVEDVNAEVLADVLTMERTVNPGAVQDPQPPPIDIDDLEPVQVQTPDDQPPVDIGDDDVPLSGDISYIYDEERGLWIPVRRTADSTDPDVIAAQERPLAIERVIEIPYQELTEGQTKYNIVIRPNDYIFVEPHPTGFIYIDGEVGRIGSYQLPSDGSQLTLSRAITSAGGLGPLAVPKRVDLTRVVGPNREATIRLDLAAIRQRTEPDVVLRPNDFIIVGTDFWATPLAIIRNGFRVTYGFGFLLDRNFGNDVFGAPPTNFRND